MGNARTQAESLRSIDRTNVAKTTDTPARPYLSSKELDAIARTQTELVSELWILRDRVRVLERLLEQAGVLKPGAIDDFDPPEEMDEALRRERDDMVSRVIGAGHRDGLDLEELRKRT